MIIRETVLEDVSACAGLVTLYLEDKFAYDLEYVLADVAAHVQQDGKFSYVATFNGQVVGIFYGFLDYNVFNGDRFARERLIYVLPEFRGMEVFTGFLTKLDRWGKENGCKFNRFISLDPKNNEAMTRLMTSKFHYAIAGSVLDKYHEQVLSKS